MAVLPLKLNKETSSVKADFLLDVIAKSWVYVLSESALKLFMYFYAKHMKGEALLGGYTNISSETSLARGSISKGLDELEAFKLINPVRKCGKTQVYELNYNVMALSNNWIKFFKVKEYKDFCINAILAKEIDNKLIDKLNLKVVNSKDDFTEKTLGKLMYMFFEKKGFEIDDLLEEEYLKMQEELFPGGLLGFGFANEPQEEHDWKSILTDEEKNHKELMKIFTHYADKVAYPTRTDIDLMKKAYKYCFPYQIILGIDIVISHPNRKDKFKSFSYIYKEVRAGRFKGTRLKNALKDKNTESINKARGLNNQIDRGHKNSSLDRVEIIDKMDDMTVDSIEDIKNGAYDIEKDALDFSDFM